MKPLGGVRFEGKQVLNGQRLAVRSAQHIINVEFIFGKIAFKLESGDLHEYSVSGHKLVII